MPNYKQLEVNQGYIELSVGENIVKGKVVEGEEAKGY
jgi:hypothetical protein